MSYAERLQRLRKVYESMDEMVYFDNDIKLVEKLKPDVRPLVLELMRRVLLGADAHPDGEACVQRADRLLCILARDV